MAAGRATDEDDEHAEDLEYEPSIRRDRGVILQQLPLRSGHVPTHCISSTLSTEKVTPRIMRGQREGLWKRGERMKRRTEDPRRDIRDIRIDPLHRLPLLRHHPCQLREDLSEFGDCGFDGFDGGGTGLYVGVLRASERVSVLES